jgi:hypothetical protein
VRSGIVVPLDDFRGPCTFLAPSLGRERTRSAILVGVKYCPNLQCPHRLRVRSPAEFLDHVASCSDCQAPLVDSEEEAIEGIGPNVGAGPYRAGRARTAAAASREDRSAAGNTALGVALILGGIGLSAFTYVSASESGGRYIVAWGPVLYGIYKLKRGARGGSTD